MIPVMSGAMATQGTELKWKEMVTFLHSHHLVDETRLPGEVLYKILSMGRACKNLWVGVVDDVGLRQDLVMGYNKHDQYSCMHQDTMRNKAYKAFIDTAKAKYWLEIGPGALGTLTEMVLERSNTKILAIEAVRSSKEEVTRRLGKYIRAGRLKVR